MPITTRAGDGGKTGLLKGQSVSKGSHRIEAFGTVDELNACLGVVLVEDLPHEIKKHLTETQRLLFRIGTDLATLEQNANVKRITQEDVSMVESWISELEDSLPQLKHFILPSGSKLGALLHQARTVCRRAERCVVRLSEKEEINDQIQIYLNRLSDYLFLAAREVNRKQGVGEVEI